MKYLIGIIFITLGLCTMGQSLQGSGNAYDLSSSSAYAEINNFGQINLPLTISSWIYYIPGSASQHIFSTDNTSSSGYHGVFMDITNNHRLRVHTGSGTVYTPAGRRAVFTIIPNHLRNNWIHVSGVVHAVGNIDIFINGIAQQTSSEGTGAMIMAQSSAPRAQVGAAFETGIQRVFFGGYIDEIVVWDTSLTQAQIREYMCKKVPPGTPNLYAYYKFDEPNASGALIDASPNGRDGSHVSGGGRVLSGAYIGDESGYT